MNISVRIMVLGMVQTNCYLVINDATKEVVVVDPGDESERLEAYFEKEGLKPVAILLTHGHFDHIMGAQGLKETYGVKIYVSERDDTLMQDPQMNGCYMIGRRVAVTGDVHVKEGDQLVLADMMFEVTETPGHTWGGVCFYMPQTGYLFCGDTLFAGSVGRTDLPTGDMHTLMQSIKKLADTYADETIVLPGHGGDSTLADEKRCNPYIRR